MSRTKNPPISPGDLAGPGSGPLGPGGESAAGRPGPIAQSSRRPARSLVPLHPPTPVAVDRSCSSLQHKPIQKKSNRRPRTATKSLRKRYEGPCVWLAYREERYLFSTHIFAPYFLTFIRRVHSQTFKGGIDAPRFLVSECIIGNQFDRVMSARDAGA